MNLLELSLYAIAVLIFLAWVWHKTLLGQFAQAVFKIIGSLFGFGTGMAGSSGSGVHGSSAFLRGLSRFFLLNPWNKGIVVDGTNCLPLKLSYKHLGNLGPTGAGKTSLFLKPNLLRAGPTPMSYVVVDPSGEIEAHTSGYLNSINIQTKVLDVSNLDASAGYNPLYRAFNAVDPHTEIEKVVNTLMKAAYPTGSSDTFWIDQGKLILNPILRCLAKEPAEYHNLANAARIIDNFGSDGSDLYHFFARNTVDDPVTFQQINGFLSQDSKVVLGGVATARAALKPMSMPNLATISSFESLNFESIRHEPTCIYIKVPEHEIKSHYGFYLSLLFSQLFSYLMKMPQKGEPYLSVQLFLEECPAYVIDGLGGIISTIRKRNVSCSLLYQSSSQLYSNYGKAEATTIQNNCVSKLFLPGLDYETTLEIERILGRTTVRQEDENGHVREFGRPLMTADEIRTMHDEEALLVHGNLPPIRLRMRPYYKIRKLRKRSQIPAPIYPYSANRPIAYLDLKPLTVAQSA